MAQGGGPDDWELAKTTKSTGGYQVTSRKVSVPRSGAIGVSLSFRQNGISLDLLGARASSSAG